MQKVISIVLVLFLVAACVSCKHALNVSDYVSYVNKKENGLKKEVVVDGFEYSMQYKPYDYIILMENKEQYLNADFDKRRNQLKGTAWFNISIKRVDDKTTPLRYQLDSREEYDSRLNYYLNNAKKDIWLIYGRDTIYPVSYLFENNYNLTPQQTMIVGFYLPTGENYPQKKMQLSYNDVIFKNGIIRASFSEDLLKNIPNLTLN